MSESTGIPRNLSPKLDWVISDARVRYTGYTGYIPRANEQAVFDTSHQKRSECKSNRNAVVAGRFGKNFGFLPFFFYNLVLRKQHVHKTTLAVPKCYPSTSSTPSVFFVRKLLFVFKYLSTRSTPCVCVDCSISERCKPCGRLLLYCQTQTR